MDMKSALELTLLELLEEDDCLVLDGKTWNLLFKLGKTYLGLSAMTVRVKVGVALEELEKEGRIRVEETYDHGGAYLIFRPLEKGEEDGRETDTNTDDNRESGTARDEKDVLLSEESGGNDRASESYAG
jgi:hypothetical protein